MEIMQLRYLKEVARQESFTRAAELLHITQSALSKSIAKLEDEVGVKLFDGTGTVSTSIPLERPSCDPATRLWSIWRMV